MENSLITIQWKNDKLVLLDQTLLPNKIVYEEYDSIKLVWQAIRNMKVRGAPAIGVTAAYGVYLGIKGAPDDSFDNFWEVMIKETDFLATSRPTAVDLFWAIDRMKGVAKDNSSLSVKEIKSILLDEAIAIHKEDEMINKMIGENLLSLLDNGMGILTHCNAGSLATTKYGTATE